MVDNKAPQGTRPTSAKYPPQDPINSNPNPNPQKWGVPGKGVGIDTQSPHITDIDQTRDKQTSRSAGSFKRDDAIIDESELKRRPHTANYNGRTAPEVFFFFDNF